MVGGVRVSLILFSLCTHQCQDCQMFIPVYHTKGVNYLLGAVYVKWLESLR